MSPIAILESTFPTAKNNTKQELLRIKTYGTIIYMNKMIARTALVATLAVSAMSLSACDTNNDCAPAEETSATDVATDNAAMFSAKGGSHGHSSSHGTTGGSHGFSWPHWFGGSHSQQCENPEPAPSANS